MNKKIAVMIVSIFAVPAIFSQPAWSSANYDNPGRKIGVMAAEHPKGAAKADATVVNKNQAAALASTATPLVVATTTIAPIVNVAWIFTEAISGKKEGVVLNDSAPGQLTNTISVTVSIDKVITTYTLDIATPPGGKSNIILRIVTGGVSAAYNKSNTNPTTWFNLIKPMAQGVADLYSATGPKGITPNPTVNNAAFAVQQDINKWR